MPVGTCGCVCVVMCVTVVWPQRWWDKLGCHSVGLFTLLSWGLPSRLGCISREPQALPVFPPRIASTHYHAWPLTMYSGMEHRPLSVLTSDERLKFFAAPFWKLWNHIEISPFVYILIDLLQDFLCASLWSHWKRPQKLSMMSLDSTLEVESRLMLKNMVALGKKNLFLWECPWW